MSNVTVCARFRPLSSKEKRDQGNSVCVKGIDNETFVFKDEKEEESIFTLDRVFHEDSAQAAVYQFLALPIVRDAVNAINGTIITYGQTGAGKTYSMEGPGIQDSNEHKKGLIPRVVDGMFEHISSSKGIAKYAIKLSMVEIYMEKVRDLLDISKENIQIKENRGQGILLSGVTEVAVMDPAEAIQYLCTGSANRAVGETQMNISSSRSHCIYLFTIQQELIKEKRVRNGKLVLVDLAGSEKADKTGAEGRALEEAKTINKSLSALGNVINALTSGSPSKLNHIPYRDSKLTRILQDALGGNSRTALLCCCSPSTCNASETLSTLRFGLRAKHIKASPCTNKDKSARIPGEPSVTKDEKKQGKILEKMKGRMIGEDIKLLEELFILEGIMFDLDTVEEVDTEYEDTVSETIYSLQETIEELQLAIKKLKAENKALRAQGQGGLASQVPGELCTETSGKPHHLGKMLGFISSIVSPYVPFSTLKMLR
ncbi:PREDICTED: kinesin-like protein KIN-1 isoform X1 [Tarenaya hassleriana]|uniref:kinesin-like protein KIN-1 isoform X1 n=1 Tax=Tarenaya hassleriana TaxID=28532 RepID=UPI00053C6546|nr:PREDICTED: kinesin-like protein KIN-1 isoform X1 [Tarenaya hassleriana]XP_010552748.1 PREDICTED: kinesin-like protein KIN-1 isoform X1 [Tarenaya hassleriana]